MSLNPKIVAALAILFAIGVSQVSDAQVFRGRTSQSPSQCTCQSQAAAPAVRYYQPQQYAPQQYAAPRYSTQQAQVQQYAVQQYPAPQYVAPQYSYAPQTPAPIYTQSNSIAQPMNSYSQPYSQPTPATTYSNQAATPSQPQLMTYTMEPASVLTTPTPANSEVIIVNPATPVPTLNSADNSTLVPAPVLEPVPAVVPAANPVATPALNVIPEPVPTGDSKIIDPSPAPPVEKSILNGT